MLDPDALDLWQLRRGLLDRRLTARALAERALEAQRRHAGLRAFVAEDPPRVLSEAAATDALLARGEDPGLAAGVPWSAKDLYGVPGYRTHAGCPRPLPERFDKAGPLVERLLAQGAPCLGKTHTVQFAFGGLGTNPHWPTPLNPWDADVERVPGGSSSGAGVSIVAGVARLALGTDTAGSVRIPAAWTGCTGLKTTAGRWPTAGIVPLSPTLDTAGVLARDVADLAFGFAVLDATAGDAQRLRAEILDPAPRRFRVGVCEAFFFDGASPGVVEAATGALGELERRGVIARRPCALPEAVPAFELFRSGGPVSAEMAEFLESELPEFRDTLDRKVAARIEAGAGISAVEYLARKRRMHRLERDAVARCDAFDALATITVAGTPPPIAQVADDEAYARENLLALRNTSVVSYLGLCALTLPAGLDAAGMPVGLQFIGPPFAEERLLAIAAAAERTLGTGRARLGIPPRIRS